MLNMNFYWPFLKSILKLWGTSKETGWCVLGLGERFSKQSLGGNWRTEFHSSNTWLSQCLRFCPLSWAVSLKNSVPINCAANTQGKTNLEAFFMPLFLLHPQRTYYKVVSSFTVYSESIHFSPHWLWLPPLGPPSFLLGCQRLPNLSPSFHHPTVYLLSSEGGPLKQKSHRHTQCSSKLRSFLSAFE